MTCCCSAKVKPTGVYELIDALKRANDRAARTEEPIFLDVAHGLLITPDLPDGPYLLIEPDGSVEMGCGCEP